MSLAMSSWNSYPKVFALGHAAITDILLDPVIVEEKVDGSQFSFAKLRNDAGELELRCRSRGAQLNVLAPDAMFQRGVDVAKDLFDQLTEGWTYRAEYLAKPKHNTLAYERTPKRHLIVFDVNTGEEKYLDYPAKASECDRLGLEIVPLIHAGTVDTIEFFRSLLDRVSILGGQKVEGVVVKNYRRFSADGKAMIGKFVSEAFKEVHGADWKERNPQQGDIVERLVGKYRTPARWAKAVQHLREGGQIENSPRDIGKLIPSASADIKAECEAEIKEALFAWAWPHIQRGTVAGLAEWYKQELLKRQFEAKADAGWSATEEIS